MNPLREARTHPWVTLAVLIILAGAVLRLLHLEADPVYRLWAGYITDEGRWTEQARWLVMDRSLEVDGWAALHLLLAPLFQAAAALSFHAFGVGLVGARFVSALSAVLMLVGAFVFFRRGFSGRVTAITLSILAFQPDLLVFGRMAIPEMSAVLASFLAFACLSSFQGSLGRVFAGGLLTSMAIAFKMTTAPLAAIFFAVSVAVGEREGVGRRALRGISFLAGLTLPGLALLAAVALAGGGAVFGWLVAGVEDLASLLRFGTQYEAVASIMYSELVASVSPLLMAAWVIGGLVATRGHHPTGTHRNVYLGSLIWIVGWLAASSVLGYFPDRYFIHLVLPLALNVGAGLGQLQRIGAEGVRDDLARVRGWRRVLVALWFALPASALLCPTLLVVGDLTGFPMDRLWQQLALVLATGMVVGWATLRMWTARNVLWLVSVILLTASLHWVLVRSGTMDAGFWNPSVSDGVVRGVAIIVAAIPTAIAASDPIRKARFAAGVFLVTLTAGWLWLAVPPILRPTYTMREAADLVEALAEPGDRVGTNDAGGIFLNTDLHYTEQLARVPSPDLLVVVFDRLLPSFMDRYDLVGRLRLNVGPAIDESRGAPTELKVYRLRQTEGGTPGIRDTPGQHPDSL